MGEIATRLSIKQCATLYDGHSSRVFDNISEPMAARFIRRGGANRLYIGEGIMAHDASRKVVLIRKKAQEPKLEVGDMLDQAEKTFAGTTHR
jgi:hypothetical protein